MTKFKITKFIIYFTQYKYSLNYKFWKQKDYNEKSNYKKQLIPSQTINYLLKLTKRTILEKMSLFKFNRWLFYCRSRNLTRKEIIQSTISIILIISQQCQSIEKDQSFILNFKYQIQQEKRRKQCHQENIHRNMTNKQMVKQNQSIALENSKINKIFNKQEEFILLKLTDDHHFQKQFEQFQPINLKGKISSLVSIKMISKTYQIQLNIIKYHNQI